MGLFHSDGMRKVMKDRFFSQDDFAFEQINRSSRACGPLAKWAIAQVQCLSSIAVSTPNIKQQNIVPIYRSKLSTSCQFVSREALCGVDTLVMFENALFGFHFVSDGCTVPCVIMQVGYADMLNRVDPLRQELATLGKQAEETQLRVCYCCCL